MKGHAEIASSNNSWMGARTREPRYGEQVKLDEVLGILQLPNHPFGHPIQKEHRGMTAGKNWNKRDTL